MTFCLSSPRMFTAFIGLGSNLENPEKQIQIFLDALKVDENITLIRVSSFYYNPPMQGSPPQPDFVNAVAEIKTTLSPHNLWRRLLHLEIMQGRVRTERWGPRIIDCDLLLYENLVINSEELVIPHYDMHNREFVLRPLFEIAPKLMLPNNTKVETLLKQFTRRLVCI